MLPNSTLDKKYTTADGGAYRAHQRMPKAKRQEQLDKALYKLLKTKGLHGVTKSALANACSISTGLLHTYYGNIGDVRKAAVMLAFDAGDRQTVLTAINHGFPLKELQGLVRATIKTWGGNANTRNT